MEMNMLQFQLLNDLDSIHSSLACLQLRGSDVCDIEQRWSFKFNFTRNYFPNEHCNKFLD